MINNTYRNASTSLDSPGPSVESLAARAANLNNELRDINSALADLRSKLFGEGECGPARPDGPVPCIRMLIEDAQARASDAHSQISSILNRL